MFQHESQTKKCNMTAIKAGKQQKRLINCDICIRVLLLFVLLSNIQLHFRGMLFVNLKKVVNIIFIVWVVNLHVQS